MNEAVVEDAVDCAEGSFAFPALLQTEYFEKYRASYYHQRELGLQLGSRNYLNLLSFLDETAEYNRQHANSFVKRLQSHPADWRNCEAVFSELIVYRHYIRATVEGLLRAIHMHRSEADIILERLDGAKAFLEVFCVMPARPRPEPGGVFSHRIQAHTQDEVASIRQKLLAKITKQKQLSVPRENYAVIELNDPVIAGDFSVLSSLSSGYTVTFDRQTMQAVSEGCDWRSSVFDDPATQHLKGVIYFSLGDYPSRRYILNPHFGTVGETHPPHTEPPHRADRQGP